MAKDIKAKKIPLPPHLAAATAVNGPPKKEPVICKDIAPHLRAHTAIGRKD